jgi:tetratricopeptide (TPR) repeat protein
MASPSRRFGRRAGNRTLSFALMLLALPALAQDWRGMGRLEGRVVGPDGKPVVNAVVKLELSSRGSTSVKTDKNGRWAVGGIAAGAWYVEVEAEGYTARKVTVRLPGEDARLPPVEVERTAAPQGPPPEVLAAVSKGDEAYKAGRFAEARAEYEKLLALRPDLGTTLHELIARCYSQEGNYAKAVEHLQALIDADPKDQNTRLLAAQEALRGGMLDKGLEMLKGLDEAQIKNPEIYYNVAVILLNQKKAEEALVYLTKSVTLEPGYVDGYFQRAMTYLQLQRLAEAKADLRHVIELAPDGRQADTARRALEQLK